MVWAVDRLGRSLPDLVATMQELHASKVDLFILQQALDTTTPAGRAMFGMLGVFAEFERAMIQSRVNAGLQGHGGRCSAWATEAGPTASTIMGERCLIEMPRSNTVPQR
jgi:hypothetical protein